ncbi:MAG TPA: class I SAM-dependent methyltransferase [Solirubrobacteraceae bacterium]
MNVCAGPFGALYDFYIERPWLSAVVGRAVWGSDVRPMYAAMEAIGRMGDGATIVDAPCGGGVALRALRPGQDVRYVAADLAPAMLDRVRGKAAARGLRQVEPVEADMRVLPLEDASADLFCSFSGLHMLGDPERAVGEIARVLRPGGTVVGSAFVAGGTRRQRLLFGVAERRGAQPALGTRADHERWLREAGLEDVSVEGRGFVVFGARKRSRDPGRL